MHDERRHGAGTEAGDGLDDGGGETRMAVLGHQSPGLEGEASPFSCFLFYIVSPQRRITDEVEKSGRWEE